jgi:hypothetical protein
MGWDDLDCMGLRREQNLHSFGESNRLGREADASQVYSKLGEAMKTHDERLQAIFQELPDLKASVDAGSLRVWVDDDGTHLSLLSKRVSKRAKYVHVEDAQHDAIESRAAELHDLIQKHPYIAQAIADQWAKVRIQEDGNLGIDFVNGREAHLGAFGDGFGEVAKASPAIPLPGYTKDQVDARVRLALIKHAIANGQIPDGCGI